jgi:hypothetical protein
MIVVYDVYHVATCSTQLRTSGGLQVCGFVKIKLSLYSIRYLSARARGSPMLWIYKMLCGTLGAHQGIRHACKAFNC